MNLVKTASGKTVLTVFQTDLHSFSELVQRCTCGGYFEYLSDDKLRSLMWTKLHPDLGIPPYDVQVCMKCGRFFNQGKQSDPVNWNAKKTEEKAKQMKSRKPVRLPNENKEHWEAKEILGPDTRTDWSGTVTTPGDQRTAGQKTSGNDGELARLLNEYPWATASIYIKPGDQSALLTIQQYNKLCTLAKGFNASKVRLGNSYGLPEGWLVFIIEPSNFVVGISPTGESHS